MLLPVTEKAVQWQPVVRGSSRLNFIPFHSRKCAKRTGRDSLHEGRRDETGIGMEQRPAEGHAAFQAEAAECEVPQPVLEAAEKDSSWYVAARDARQPCPPPHTTSDR